MNGVRQVGLTNEMRETLERILLNNKVIIVADTANNGADVYIWGISPQSLLVKIKYSKPDVKGFLEIK